MSRVCQYCGKRVHVGNTIARRGLAKPKGGIGLKTTGINRRKFKPNVQRVRALVGGQMQRVKICARCIKSGKISKGFKRRPADAV
ncbi:MAG: 50S ribosomal protein L28 [Planctomycetes bacterium]|nr:50S ribosomal protein L28 [Planctomycetota bacterium]